MTNDEIRRNDEIRMTKPPIGHAGAIRHSGFGFLSSFVIRISSFRWAAPDRSSELLFVVVAAAICWAAGFAGVAAESGATYINPVLAGDYPDPSVIRVGRDYWATATSSEWGPQFPILHSRDLVNWKIIGAVFPKRPAWATGNFWAAEMSED